MDISDPLTTRLLLLGRAQGRFITGSDREPKQKLRLGLDKTFFLSNNFMRLFNFQILMTALVNTQTYLRSRLGQLCRRSRDRIIIHVDVFIVLLYFFILISEEFHACPLLIPTSLILNRLLRELNELAATTTSLELLGRGQKLSRGQVPSFKGNLFHLVIRWDNRCSRYSL